MFSNRIHWDITPNALTLLLHEKRARGETILDLTVSNPTTAGFIHDEADILAALSQPNSLQYEPSHRGLISAREAVAEYYAGHDIAVHPEHVHLTASTSEAYGFLFKLLLDPGDEVLIPSPSYPLLEFLAGLELAQLRRYSLRYTDEDGWETDMLSLEAQLTERTRAVVAVNPNNPTGSYLKQRELRRLKEFCASNNLALIADEVFFDFDLDTIDPPRSVLSDADDTLCFALNGFSKILGLPQMKLGWIVTHAPPALRDAALARLDLICDTYLSVNTPVQQGAAAMLKTGSGIRQQMRARCRRNLDVLRSFTPLHNLPSPLRRGEVVSIRTLRVEGGWSAMLALPDGVDEDAFTATLLREENVYVHPGYFFDAKPGHVVVSLLTREDIFKKGMTAFERHAGR